MERGIVDRFEKEIVVIEIGGKTRDFPKAVLPRNVKIGDSVILENGEIRIDAIETSKRKKEIESLMDELFE